MDSAASGRYMLYSYELERLVGCDFFNKTSKLRPGDEGYVDIRSVPFSEGKWNIRQESNRHLGGTNMFALDASYILPGKYSYEDWVERVFPARKPIGTTWRHALALNKELFVSAFKDMLGFGMD